MVILKKLKKQLNQFRSPEIEALPDSKINLYAHGQLPQVDKNAPPTNPKPIPSHSKLGMSKGKKLHNSSAEAKAFKEKQAEAYSHGLEQIYSLENIDISTLKTIGGTQEEEAKEEKTPALDYQDVSDSPQLDFDLGGEYRSHIESFTLNEPVTVLNLSPPALKNLRQSGKCVIRDLVGLDWSQLAITHGIGQGHVEEIKEKFREYTRSKSLERCHNVDFMAWLRCLIPDENLPKHYVLLDSYGLSQAITLTPAAKVEVRMLSDEKKRLWAEESLEEFKSNDRQTFCLSSMETLCNTFIKPWLRGRHGFGKDYELKDRLESISTDPTLMPRVVKFLQDTFYEGVFPLRTLLPVVGDRLFFADLEVLDKFIAVEKVALTYFYQEQVEYPLPELTAWVTKEFALKWEGFAEGFVEKVLRSSERLRTRKGDDLLVSLNFASTRH